MTVESQNPSPRENSHTAERVAGADPWSSAKYRYYFLGLLVLSYMINFMDRQILSILLEPIKNDLELQDWQLGTLGGIAFALFYVTLGLPIAKLSDRFNRVNILSIAIVSWSLATAACGLAANFFHMLLARIGVAVGESAGTPPSYSMIGDLFAPAKRATATGIYVVGPQLGTAGGLIFGGWAADVLGWREAFFIISIPGLLLALVIKFTLKEPPRGYSEKRTAEGEASTVLGMARLLSTRMSFVTMAFASGIASFSGYAMALWLPSFFIRSYDLSVTQAGLLLAVLYFISGILGGVLGGMVADRLGTRDKRWWMFVPGCAMLVAAPCCLIGFTIDSFMISIVAITIAKTMYHSWAGPVYSAAQGMVGLRMRAVTVSLLLFIVNLVGLGFGPPIIGLVSDLLQQEFSAQSLRYSLILTSPVFLISSFLYFTASRFLVQDLDRAPA